MDPSPPLIDLRSQGIGDLIVAAWICHGARKVAATVHVNARAHKGLAIRLGLDTELVETESDDWSRTADVGLRHENKHAAAGLTRVGLWCQSVGLPVIEPVRPPYEVTSEEREWAEQQWGWGEAGGGPQQAGVGGWGVAREGEPPR